GIYSADLRAGRGLPVRLVGGMDRPRRHRLQGSSRARPALPQPHALHPGVSAAEPGDDVRRPCPGLCFLGRRLRARHLRQHEDGGGRRVRRQGAQVQPPLRPDVLALPGRADGLYACGRLGEGTGREPGRSLRQRLFIPRPHVKTLEELNLQLEDGCVAYARESRHPDDRERTVWEAFEAERPALVPIRGPFDGFREVDVGSSKTCLVRFDRNRYSIEAKAANRPVQLRAYADRVVVRFDGEVVATHERVFGRDRVRYNPLHYLPVLARKPGALRNGAPFKDWELPPNLTKLRARLGRSDEADRQFVGILAAIPEDGLDAVEEACRLALSEGLCSRDAVLNILSWGRDRAPPAPLAAPSLPQLRLVPTADCARYDRLRVLIPEVDRGAA